MGGWAGVNGGVGGCGWRVVGVGPGGFVEGQVWVAGHG